MKHLRIPLLLLLLAAALALTAGAASQFPLEVRGADGVYVSRGVTAVGLTYNGAALAPDVPAFLLDGRTMVPVRVVSEQLGASVTWQGETQQVQIENGSTTVVLTIGSAEALVNGKTVQLYDGVPAALVRKDGVTRTMVPLRFVSDQLGAGVGWDAESCTAAITTAQEVTSDVSVPVVTNGTVTVSVKGGAQPTIFALDGRAVIDFPGGVFTGSSHGTVAATGAAVRSVRYNQFDSGYEGFSHVARLVLDLNDGYAKNDLSISFENGVLTVAQPAGSTPAAPPENENPLIVLDAGHGGSDVGAPYNGCNEKDIDLAITLKLGALLTSAGYRVEYTRTADTTVSLADRAGLANTLNADIFVCIHANAYAPKPEVSGLETYYLIGGERSKTLAADIHNAILASVDVTDRGVRTANYYVLKNTLMPAVLVETGYVTNAEECARLNDESYQQQLAEAITHGIQTYFAATG